MRTIFSLLLLCISFQAFPKGYVYGKVYIQTRYNQSVRSMACFPAAAVEAAQANSTVTIADTFMLEFPGINAGTEVNIDVPENKLILNGQPYEVVNINSLRAIAVDKHNKRCIQVMVCRKGMRDVFEKQMAEFLFKDQLKKAEDDPERRELLYQAASVVLSNKYSIAERASTEIQEPLDNSDYLATKRYLEIFQKEAFNYLNQEKKSGLIHKLLHKESVKNIQAYASVLQFTLETRKAIQVYEDLYKINKEDIEVVIGFAGVLVYVERYNDAIKLLESGYHLQLFPAERAELNICLGRIYTRLDRTANARNCYTQAIEELNRIPSPTLEILDKVRDMNYLIAYGMPLDSSILYYKKSLAISRQMLRLLGDTGGALPQETSIDSSDVYYNMSLYYRDQFQMDSVRWSLNTSLNYLTNKDPQLYSKRIKIITDQLNGGERMDLKRERAELEAILSWPETKGNAYERAKAHQRLIEHYVEEGNFQKARVSQEKALKIYTDMIVSDVMFRKLRINICSLYQLKGGICYNQNLNLDSALFFYKKALHLLSETKQSVRESYSEEILEMSRAVLEWFNVYSNCQQGLLREDPLLMQHKLFFDSLMFNCTSMYKRNPDKYKVQALTSFLLAASVYATNRKTMPEAIDFAQKAHEIMERYECTFLGELKEGCFDRLKNELGYDEAVYAAVGNMFWLKGDVKTAQEYYWKAGKANTYQSTWFDLPRARIYLTLNAPIDARSVSESMCEHLRLDAQQSARLPGSIKNHYAFVAAMSTYQLNEYDKSYGRLKELFENSFENYSYSDSAFYLAIRISNLSERFAEAAKFSERIPMSTQALDPSTLLEQVWTLICLNKEKEAMNLYEKIVSSEISKKGKLAYAQYLGMGIVLYRNVPVKVKLYETLAKQQLDPDSTYPVFFLNRAYLALQLKQLPEVKKSLKKAGKLLSGKGGILEAEYLKLAGLRWRQENETLKATTSLEEARKLYLKYEQGYPYQYEQINKLISP